MWNNQTGDTKYKLKQRALTYRTSIRFNTHRLNYAIVLWLYPGLKEQNRQSIST